MTKTFDGKNYLHAALIYPRGNGVKKKRVVLHSTLFSTNQTTPFFDHTYLAGRCIKRKKEWRSRALSNCWRAEFWLLPFPEFLPLLWSTFGNPSVMLFWHSQPDHYWPSPGEMYPCPGNNLIRWAASFFHPSLSSCANSRDLQEEEEESMQVNQLVHDGIYEIVVMIRLPEFCLFQENVWKVSQTIREDKDFTILSSLSSQYLVCRAVILLT